MMEDSGMDTASTYVSASKEAPKLQKCARYWQKGDSAWNRVGTIQYVYRSV